MVFKDWIELISALAWPVVAVIGLIYIWKSDAIANLIKISSAVDELRDKLKELIEAEERLSKSANIMSNLTVTIDELRNEFLLIKADVENIQDSVDKRQPDVAVGERNKSASAKDLQNMFSSMNDTWQELNNILDKKFGWFDRRMTGSEAYRFAHGNRKGPRLEYEQADEIARLHSSIKSYRRRHSSLEDWLDEDIRNEFTAATNDMIKQISTL